MALWIGVHLTAMAVAELSRTQVLRWLDPGEEEGLSLDELVALHPRR